MRRFGLILLLLLALCLLLTPCLATEEEDDIFLADITPKPTATPDPAFTPVPAVTPEPTPEPQYLPDGSQYFTVTAIGDVTIGKSLGKSRFDYFGKELRNNQGDDPAFIFKNVRDIFEKDDLTIANFECVLQEEGTQKIPSEKKNNDFLFLGEPRYVQALTENSIEAVAFENNHMVDFGPNGMESTIRILQENGIVYSNLKTVGSYEYKGIRVAMLSYKTLRTDLTPVYSSDEIASMAAAKIAAIRDQYDLIIVSYHWGNEKDYVPEDKQIKLARATIDAGADLVLGHHSHRINPIEEYNGKYIVYSLGNASFAGHNKPSDMSTFVFQARYRIREGEIIGSAFRIIPCRISSRTDYNNFILTPYTEQKNIDAVLNVLRNNGKKLKYAVSSYPLEWE